MISPDMSPYNGPGDPPEGKVVTLRTLCTECQTPIVCEWPEEMSWAGLSVTPQEYMANAIRNQSTEILCDACLQRRPDVRVEDLILDE